jgi:hypothetical protein
MNSNTMLAITLLGITVERFYPPMPPWVVAILAAITGILILVGR